MRGNPCAKGLAVAFSAACLTGAAMLAPAITPLDTFNEHQSTVRAVAWSADGRFVATGDDQGIVKIWTWDAKTAKAMVPDATKDRIDPLTRRVTALRFSPDSSTLFVGGIPKDGMTSASAVYSLGAPLHSWNAGAADALVAPSADGTRVATAANKKVSVHDLTKKSDRDLHTASNPIISLAWRSGKIASGHQKALNFWDPDTTDDPVGQIVSPEDPALLAYAAGSEILVSVDPGASALVRTWDPSKATGTPTPLSTSTINVVAATAPGASPRLAAASEEATKTATRPVVTMWKGAGLATPAVSKGGTGLTGPLALLAIAPGGEKLLAADAAGNFGIVTPNMDFTLPFTKGGRGHLTAIALAAGSQRLALGFNDGTIRIVKDDGNDDSAVGAPASLGNPIVALAFHPTNPNRLLAASTKKAVSMTLGATTTSSDVKSFSTAESFTALAFSGNKGAAGTDAGNVFVWDDPPTGAALTPFSVGPSVTALALATTTPSFLSVGTNDNAVSLWDNSHQSLLQKFAGATKPIKALTLEVPGNEVPPSVIGAARGETNVRSWPGVALRAFAVGEPAVVNALATTQDRIVIGLANNKAVAFDYTGDNRLELGTHASPVTGLAVSRTSPNAVPYVFTVSDPSTIKAFRIDSGAAVATASKPFVGLTDAPKVFTVSSDASWGVARFDGGTIRVGRIGSDDRFDLHPPGKVGSLTLQNGLRLVAGPDETGLMTYWTTAGLTGTVRAPLGNDPVLTVDWGPVSSSIRLFRDAPKKVLRSVDPTANAADADFVDVPDDLRALAVAPDGSALVSGGLDKQIALRDPDAPKAKAKSLTATSGLVTALAFHPQSALIASGTSDKDVALWQVNIGAGTTASKGHDNTKHIGVLRSVAFSPDGLKLASLDSDGTLVVWKISSSPSLVFQATHHLGAGVLGTQLAWSNDNETLVVGGTDKKAHIVKFRE